uniref:Uncharacterized protein n=1 Tax=Anguilla anguilla TaxID=7936 RepID=A0A0E9TFN8_ANGAN
MSPTIPFRVQLPLASLQKNNQLYPHPFYFS